MNMDVFSFVVYMIHACADRWNLSPAQVYRGMKRAGCISGYLAPHYDVLHTQGRRLSSRTSGSIWKTEVSAYES